MVNETSQRRKEHVHRAMVFICGVTFAIAGLLGLLMLYLVYLAIHVGEPVRLRAAVEESTTLSDSTTYTGHLRHYLTGVPPECLYHPVFHKCLVNESFPLADRFDQWRGVDGNASGRPWYFQHGSCLEWTPEAFCLERSRAHFADQKTCARHCERGVPLKRCTQHLPAPLRSSCASSDEGAPEWWFYDARTRRCRKWRNVCVRPAYTSYRACAKRCRPRRNVHA
ncbi:hypothetical protein HPB49_001743 [Dermacentor silvarum]|uniref:Uncharacterized protein n=1 Tax=Dermacentor silvarum TaxID=543639 RepID=A0ACB8CCZ2_DERSI|nr:hypothetical protein HPB49_001743 [Dermacentor silvarum]